MWANVTITALHNPQGELVGFAKVTRDLTERRADRRTSCAPSAEQAALAEKARIQEFQERFLAILGHDLRNPLAAIDMGTGMLRQQGQTRRSRVIDRMRSSSLRMSRMIEQILDLTRSRLAGGFGITLGRSICASFFRASPKRFGRLGRSASSSFAAARSPALGTGTDRTIVLEPDRQRDHHGEPPPRHRDRGRGRPEVWVEVHNYGPPIPPELQRVLFDPFRRGERDSRTAKTEGLVWVLHFARDRACPRRNDRGPLEPRRRNDISRHVAPRGIGAKTQGIHRMAHTVLIVEDEEDLRDMLRDALELNGYAVVTASNGQEALNKIESIDQLCLVILDLLDAGHEWLGLLSEDP